MIISGLLVARWIFPEVLGKFNSFTIFSSYIIMVQLGVPAAFGRELPFHLGRNQIETAERFAQTAQFHSVTGN